MAAWIRGEVSSVEDAVAAASALLGAARTPVVAGLCADVAAVRAACDLAFRIGASLDTVGAAGTYAELGALGRGGAMTAPPAEVVGRADVVLALGAAPWGAPLLRTLAQAGPTRGRAAGGPRTLLALGGPAPPGVDAWSAEGGLPEAIALLRACRRGHLRDTPSADLVEKLRAARYGVLIYDPAELGAFGVEMAQALAVELAEDARVFTLALSGPDQDRTVVPVVAWTTGQAPRTGFGRGLPEHDPWRFDAARQAAAAEADAALWLAALPAPRPDWLATLPAVALVGEADAMGAAEADVVIAVARPGHEAGGVLWDDGRAALAYRPARGPSDLPTAAAVIGAIGRRLGAGAGAPGSVPAC